MKLILLNGAWQQAYWDNAEQMDSQRRWQRSTCHQGSSTSQHWGSSLQGKEFHHTAWGQPSLRAGSSWQQMGNQQRWQRSTCHQGSSTSQHWGNSLQGMVFRHIVRLLSIEHWMHWQQPEKREQSSTSSWMKYGLLLNLQKRARDLYKWKLTQISYWRTCFIDYMSTKVSIYVSLNLKM